MKSLRRMIFLAIVVPIFAGITVNRALSAPRKIACINTAMLTAAIPDDIPNVVLQELKALKAPFYGVPALFVARPNFYSRGNRGKGAFTYLHVWKGDDLEIRGHAFLPGTRYVGWFTIQKGAALRGLQHVPLVLPRRGCWRITITTERAKVSFYAKVGK